MESVMATGRILTRNSARWGGAIAVAALIQSCWGPCAFQFCGSNMKATAGYNRGYRFQRYRLCFHSEHSRRQWKLHNCGCKICSHSSQTLSRTTTRCVCTGSAVWAQQLHKVAGCNFTSNVAAGITPTSTSTGGGAIWLGAGYPGATTSASPIPIHQQHPRKNWGHQASTSFPTRPRWR